MSDWLHRKLRDRLPEAVRSRVPERRVRPDESSAVPESPGESAPVVPRTWREEGEWAEPEQSRVMPEAQHEEGWVQWEMGDPVMLDAITAPGTGRVYAVYTGKPQATGFKELEPGVVSAAPGTRGVVGSVGVDFVVVQVPVEELEIDFEGLPKSEARRYERAIGNGATALAFAFSKKDVVPWLDEPEDPDVEWDPVEQQKRQWGGKWGTLIEPAKMWELVQKSKRVLEALKYDDVWEANSYRWHPSIRGVAFQRVKRGPEGEAFPEAQLVVEREPYIMVFYNPKYLANATAEGLAEMIQHELIHAEQVARSEGYREQTMPYLAQPEEIEAYANDIVRELPNDADIRSTSSLMQSPTYQGYARQYGNDSVVMNRLHKLIADYTVNHYQAQWGGKWGRTAGWSGLELKQTFARIFEKLPGARPEHQQRLVDYLAALEQMLRDEGGSDHAAQYMAEGRAKHPEAARIIDSLVPGPVDPSYRAGPGRAIDIDDMVEPDYDDVDDEGIVACPECSMETLEELGECEYCGAALDFSQFEAQRTGKWGEKAVVTVDEVVTCS